MLAVLVLLFGARNWPELARRDGQSLQIFREEARPPDALDQMVDPPPAER